MDDEYEEVPEQIEEPTEQDIIDYMKWLGADVEKDKDLFYIGRQALTARLPEGWKTYQKKDGGEPFYFNIYTGESLWDHPLDAQFKKQFQEAKARKAQQKPVNSSLANKSGAKPLLATSNNKNTMNLAPIKASQYNSNNGHNPNNGMQNKQNRTVDVPPKGLLSIDRKQGNNDQNHQMKIDATVKENKEEEEKIKRLTEELKRKRESYEEELEQIKKEHERKKSQMKTENGLEIQKLRQQLDENTKKIKNQLNVSEQELKDAKQQQDSDLKNNVAIEQKRELDEMKEQFEQQKQKLRKLYDDELNNLKKEHEKNIQKEKDKQEEELDDIKNTYEK